ncbi:hypothetical protein B0T16DRAFT_461415 [Cercophora newfieldiana]|uniref:Uncharacterized protein n=1 Tax=Cercophora newfieldiana TaxID=92897 RepID=A0AA39XW35_9PEZI|nr:hypothetical protein B0T16DRAFT_461415 [Cercophora newfieldiana]
MEIASSPPVANSRKRARSSSPAKGPIDNDPDLPLPETHRSPKKPTVECHGKALSKISIIIDSDEDVQEKHNLSISPSLKIASRPRNVVPLTSDTVDGDTIPTGVQSKALKDPEENMEGVVASRETVEAPVSSDDTMDVDNPTEVPPESFEKTGIPVTTVDAENNREHNEQHKAGGPSTTKDGGDPIKNDPKGAATKTFIDIVVLNSEVFLDARNAIGHTIQRVFQIMMPEHPAPDPAEIMNLITMCPYLPDIYGALGARPQEDPELKMWIKRHKNIYRNEGMKLIGLRDGALDFLKAMRWYGMPVLVLTADPVLADRVLKDLGLGDSKLIQGIYPCRLPDIMDGRLDFRKIHMEHAAGNFSQRFSPVIKTLPQPSQSALSEIIWVSCTPHSMEWAKRLGLQTCWLKVTSPPVDYVGFDFKVESLGALERAVLEHNQPFTNVDPDDYWGTGMDKGVEGTAEVDTGVKAKNQKQTKGAEVESGEKKSGKAEVVTPESKNDSVVVDDELEIVEVRTLNVKAPGINSASGKSVKVKIEPGEGEMHGATLNDAEPFDVDMEDVQAEGEGVEEVERVEETIVGKDEANKVMEGKMRSDS